MQKVKCSFCENTMEVDDEPLDQAMVYSGGINWFTMGYGSKFDTESWLLAMCDDCLEKADPVKIIEYM